MDISKLAEQLNVLEAGIVAAVYQNQTNARIELDMPNALGETTPAAVRRYIAGVDGWTLHERFQAGYWLVVREDEATLQ